jgi:transcriptional regulator with XRE-family HTH domain
MKIAEQIALVGPRIRAIRAQQRMTLAQLASATSISESTLSRLEMGARKPTLELLLGIASGLGVPLDEIVTPPSPAPRKVTRGGMTAIPLTRRASELQAFKMVMPPTHPDAVRPAGRHEGFEWIYVLSGCLELTLGDETVVLGAGEAAEFDTRVAHAMRNPGPAVAELLTLFGPQGERMHVRARTESHP